MPPFVPSTPLHVPSRPAIHRSRQTRTLRHASVGPPVALVVGASAPFVAFPIGASPSAPSAASPAVTSHPSSVAATSATTTAIDDPPIIGTLGLAPLIAKPSTFAPRALASIVSATTSAGPSSSARALADQLHPFVQSKPP